MSVNEYSFGIDMTVGHLRINPSEVVAESVKDELPSNIMVDGNNIVNLRVKVEETVRISSQPDRIFAVFLFESRTVLTKRDVIDLFKKNTDIGEENFQVSDNPGEIIEELRNVESIDEKREVLK